MKYMAIIYGNKALWESFSSDQAAEAIAAQDAFNQRYAQSGELLAAYGLGDELTAKTVRVREGTLAVTDGPYIEAKGVRLELLPVGLRERGARAPARFRDALRVSQRRGGVAGVA